jgi:hypothetical protein
MPSKQHLNNQARRAKAMLNVMGIRTKRSWKSLALACVPADQEIGKHAGHYLRKFQKSHGVELGDALIPVWFDTGSRY